MGIRGRMPLERETEGDKWSFLMKVIPRHEVWCEPFFHTGSVFFRKRPSHKEIINDTQDRMVNFYLMLKERGEQLQFLAESTLHADVFARLADEVENTSQDRLLKAWAFWLKYEKSFISPASWSVDEKLNTDGGRPAEWKLLAKRLANTFISCRDPFEVIRQADGRNTLFYLDVKEHRHLLLLQQVLQQVQGMVILTGEDARKVRLTAEKCGLMTDEECRQRNIYLNFRRERTLFD